MSTRKFAVGDRVRVIFNPVFPDVVGTETVIIGGPQRGRWPDGETGEAWEVNLPNRHPYQAAHWPFAFYPSCALELLRDGNQAVSWSECAWQPRTLKV